MPWGEFRSPTAQRMAFRTMKPNDSRIDSSESPGLLSFSFGLLLLTFLGIWPALTNGQPFFYADTTAYVRGADMAISRVFGPRFATEWALGLRRAVSVDGSVRETERTTGLQQDSTHRTVLAGRSIIYGALLYLGAFTGGFWVSIIIQSLAVSYLLYLFIVRVLRLNHLHWLLCSAALFLTSSISFYVSDLMPDLFAGLLLLAFAILVTGWARLSQLEFAVTTSVILFAVLAHNSHVLLLIAVTIFAITYGAVSHRWGWRQSLGILTLTAGCLVLAVLWESAFAFGVTRALGTPPIRPPFISARLVSMLGAPAVSRVCASNDFAVCRFQDRFPTDIEKFCWSEDKGIGVFNVADERTKRALSQEQLRLALAMIPKNPVRFAYGTLRDAAHQLIVFSLDEYSYDPDALSFFVSRLPDRDFARMQSSVAAHSLRYVTFGRTVVYATAVLGAIGIVVLLARSPASGTATQHQDWRVATYIFLAGVVLNALICGGLSSINNRYEARVIWLVPLACITGLLLAAQSTAIPTSSTNSKG